MLVVGTFCAQAHGALLTSPDRHIAVDVTVSPTGALTYAVTRDGNPVILQSNLGIAVQGADRLTAAARVTNPASRRVLVKCGFQFVEQGMIHSRGAGGAVSVDRFAIDRSTWRALKQWGRMTCLSSA